MARDPKETDAQYTRRLMEQHKDAIDRLSSLGMTKKEQELDDYLAFICGEKPKNHEKTIRPLFEILYGEPVKKPETTEKSDVIDVEYIKLSDILTNS